MAQHALQNTKSQYLCLNWVLAHLNTNDYLFMKKTFQLLALLIFSSVLLFSSCIFFKSERENPKPQTSCIDSTQIKPDVACIEIYKPVCGCDGKTYPNDCYASRAGLTSWTEGPCPEEENACIDPQRVRPDKACPRNYQPVCGCDGKTYSNACEAEKAGLKHYADGPCHPCQDPSAIRKAPASKVYKPVCGCNGRTYANEELARHAGLKSWTEGPCEDCIDPRKIDPDKGCGEIYLPVCGCNGKTYPNRCEAQKAGVKHFAEGPCDPCQDPAAIRMQPCPDVYDPVCGCNGKTYPNACAARNAGLKSWTDGKCPE